MIGALIGVGGAIFLAFSGGIYALGRLRQTVDDVKQQLNGFADMRGMITDMSNRLTALEVVVGRRGIDG